MSVPAHDHGAAEPFPRATVRDLVGENLEGTRLREVWQEWSVALGLALFALALPTARLLGDGPALVQATERGAWISFHVLLQPLAHLVALLPGVGAERAWSLIAAASWGGTYVVLSRTALSLGIPRPAAMISSLLVLGSPLGFLAGTLPGPSATAMLGSALLFMSMIETVEPASRSARTALRPLEVWLAVCLLNPVLVLLLPAVVWKLLGPRRLPVPSAWTTAGAILGAGVLLALMLGTAGGVGLSTSDPGAIVHSLGLLVSGRSSVGAPSGLIWTLVMIPALGVAVIGAFELLRRPTEQTESPPPGWILPFVAVPIAARLLGGSPSLTTGAWVLGPVLALGLASLLGRTFPRWHWATIVGLCGAQLVFTAGFRVTLVLGDPDRKWTDLASVILEPGDLVLTRDQEHEYLLRHRFHLRTINLRIPHELGGVERADWWASSSDVVRTQARSGGRVVVDWRADDPEGGGRGYKFQSELHELVLLAPIRHIDPQEARRDSLDNVKIDEDIGGE